MEIKQVISVLYIYTLCVCVCVSRSQLSVRSRGIRGVSIGEQVVMSLKMRRRWLSRKGVRREYQRVRTCGLSIYIQRVGVQTRECTNSQVLF